MPHFSIVMPTRNRANLLAYALRSVLEQTFDDYEVVVSDNQSTDDTAGVVQRLGTGRVRYFRTPEPLSMSDSWEFAVSKAQGEWITLLCDDDAMCPHLLARVQEVILGLRPRLVSWPFAAYYLDTYHVPEQRGRVARFHASGRALAINSREQLRKLFGLQWTIRALPRMLNACCHRSLISEVQRRLGRLFLPPCPDFASCAALLAHVDEYTFINDLVALAGSGSHQVGYAPSYGRGSSHVAFFEDLKPRQEIRYCPLHLLLSTNAVAESLLTVKEAMPERFPGIHVNWVRYFLWSYYELQVLGRHGVDISSDRAHFFHVLSQQAPQVQVQVRLLLPPLDGLSLLTAGEIRRRVARSPVLGRLVSAARGQVLDRARFDNILEAARHVSAS
jgi:glycosyltransferase involved in cell wall biosynthesis